LDGTLKLRISRRNKPETRERQGLAEEKKSGGVIETGGAYRGSISDLKELPLQALVKEVESLQKYQTGN